MKKLMKLLVAIALTCFASTAWALPMQPAVDPTTIAGDLDYGVFSLVEDSLGLADDLRALAYDNFSIDETYVIDTINWSGIYAEQFPNNPVADTNFLIRILEDNGGAPDLGAVSHTITVAGGLAGQSSGDLTVTPLGTYVSPVTLFNPIGGGSAFDYEASVMPFSLGPGNYWISITASQEFDTPGAVDPEWMWHLGEDPATAPFGVDGFYAYDHLFPTGIEDIGELFDKNLAFGLKGAVIPEPGSAFMALIGMVSLGLIRRKRNK